jgi:hypothetical protein
MNPLEIYFGILILLIVTGLTLKALLSLYYLVESKEGEEE